MVFSGFYLNRQVTKGDNSKSCMMTLDQGAQHTKFSDVSFSFGYKQAETHRLFSNGRERIFGTPPDWLKEVLSDDINIESSDQF